MKFSRLLVTAIVAAVAMVGTAGTAAAHTSPEYFWDHGNGFVSPGFYRHGHLHSLDETSARPSGGPLACAGGQNQNGSYILDANKCSYTLSVQDFNNVSMRWGYVEIGGGGTGLLRAREDF